MSYGKFGRIAVDISLALSQSGFCCAYVYFIKENFNQILLQQFGVNVDTQIIALACFFLFSLLCYIRKIEIFAATHVFADFMIVIALITISFYASQNLH
jgi:amino acid permease